MFVKLLVASLLIGSLCPQFAMVYAESYRAKGQFTCNGSAYFDTIVEAWEKDAFSDDREGTLAAYNYGRFQIGFSENELNGIEPYLKFFHRCGHEDLKENCYWMETLKVVTNKSRIGAIDDLGIIELLNYSSNSEVESGEKVCDRRPNLKVEADAVSEKKAVLVAEYAKNQMNDKEKLERKMAEFRRRENERRTPPTEYSTFLYSYDRENNN